ncbi:MAG: hypothetical protein IJI68_05860 [Eggerthellaceae bacterium]|nr:hypothetical protein [Eggerthellaceae bacterium]
MYHELTYEELARRRRMRIIYAILAVLIVINVVFAVTVSRSIARDQATASVRQAVVAAAVQCCAIEGSYPSMLSHLEEEYGLVINHNDYVVNYEWLGDNVPPSVVVRPR